MNPRHSVTIGLSKIISTSIPERGSVLGANESIVKFPVIVYRLYLEINRSK